MYDFCVVQKLEESELYVKLLFLSIAYTNFISELYNGV